MYLPYINNPNFVLSTIAQCSYKVIFNAQNANLGSLKQDGIDASVDYQFRSALGNWQLGGSITKILNLKRQLSPVTGMTDVLSTLQFPVSTRGRLSLGWELNGLSANLFANYTGAYTNNAPITVAGVAQPVATVPSWTTLDLTVGYETDPEGKALWSGMRFGLGVQNLANKAPPTVLSSASAFAFDSQNANPLGRIWSLTVSKAF